MGGTEGNKTNVRQSNQLSRRDSNQETFEYETEMLGNQYKCPCTKIPNKYT